jgi:demethylmenaquinone methyltransferase/2-methoxy-6-polyprenyl-1,4-benzoquinol methylase
MSEKIKGMFADISAKYDILNDLLSFGSHRIWKNKLIKLSQVKSNSKVLDIATGTGDIAYLFSKKSKSVTAIDFTPEMINLAKKRFKDSNITFIIADALELPFEDNYFDIVSISFGIRNVDDINQAIKEMHRVLKSNGKMMILEFGQAIPPFSYLYNFYSKYVIPIIGKIVSKNDFAYNYLPESSARFPSGNNFVKIINHLNLFHNVKMYRLFYGIAYIYIGIKL